jgi:hypothetical protein
MFSVSIGLVAPCAHRGRPAFTEFLLDVSG